jgi:hypothetical protein
VPSNVFGGITDCEGGGGWVSRTPFLPELRIISPLLVNRPASLPPPEMLVSSKSLARWDRLFSVQNCGFNGIIVDMKAKRSPNKLPKKKVVVKKASFDAVLEKLISSKPVPRKD